MKLSLTIFLAAVAFTLSAYGTEYKFDIPDDFLVCVHGTLHVTAPAGWNVTNTIIHRDPYPITQSPDALSPVIEATNSAGTVIDIIPFDLRARSVVTFLNDQLCKDSTGAPLPKNPIQGPYAKGSVCLDNPASPSRAQGDLESGSLIIGFVSTLSDSNDWQDVQSILKSFRFEENESVQQGGPGYPPQSVGSPDP